MTTNNDSFGGKNLFDYFNGSFSSPLESQSKDTESSDDKKSDDKSFSPLLNGKRNASQPIKPSVIDSCSDYGCDDQDLKDSDLSEEEKDALSEDQEENEKDADENELAGKSPSTEPKSTAGKIEEKPVFTSTTFICYAGINRPITKYIALDKLSVATLDDVRKALQKDHPECSKSRTKMDWDAKQNIIVPIITGGKKGAFFIEGSRGFFSTAKELFENKEIVNILAAQDGFYEVRENPIGIFVAKSYISELQNWEGFQQLLTQLPEINSLDQCQEGFKLSLPKIPEHLILQLISFFADYSALEVEVMGVLYWDSLNKNYVLNIPQQKVSKESIEPNYTEFRPNLIRVAEIHSHNTMRAYFSSIDNEDEIGTMLYGVIGRIIKGDGVIRFDIKTRAGVAGKFLPLLSSVWIEGNYDNQDDSWNLILYTPYPQKWRNRVVISTQEVL
ncbi:hypothetical protein [Paenibacillus sp. FSL R5-0914]|uniref:hypothetical protein n=1 Tax=Paenibacillus sp. FSL R5-0914 TaxID=2921665 RepID=UPI0030FA9A58